MGMFDYVRCERPLHPDAPGGLWQTKDTPEQYLTTYVITSDGRLTLDGCTVPFRGEVRFYSSGADGEWWEFSALYDSGHLLNLQQLSPTKDADHE